MRGAPATRRRVEILFRARTLAESVRWLLALEKGKYKAFVCRRGLTGDEGACAAVFRRDEGACDAVGRRVLRGGGGAEPRRRRGGVPKRSRGLCGRVDGLTLERAGLRSYILKEILSLSL